VSASLSSNSWFGEANYPVPEQHIALRNGTNVEEVQRAAM